jgi:hypothetical protein
MMLEFIRVLYRQILFAVKAGGIGLNWVDSWQ